MQTINSESELPPNHLIHHARIGLDDLHNFRRDVLIHIIRYRNPMVAGGVHGNGCVHGLEEALLVDASEDEAGLVQGLRPFGRSADADGREGMTNAGEERGLLGQGAAVRYHGESVHLEAVVVVEA